MASHLIPSHATEGLHGLLDNACRTDLPCASATVVSATSELFHKETVSSIGQDNDGQLTHKHECNDRIYWFASCTKLVTAIACMQLVEQKKLALDDGNQLEGLCPELRDVKVLESDGSMTEKNKKITLRMLLTHTAGFGYSFLSKKLDSYNEFSGSALDMHQPLVNQPGERFEYGISMDWAGIAVERATQTKLDDYTQKYIFEPLGINDMSFLPSRDMRARLAGFWQRDANDRLSPRQYPLSKPLVPDQASDMFQSGGAGLWGTTREYSKLLRVLLNNGTSPLTGKAILQPDTVEMMFENQLTRDPDFARTSLSAVKPELVYPSEELYPLCPDSEPQGWGLGFMISPGVTGRSKHTAHWSGLSNCFWWCDREKGVAGIVASQLLPFPDLKVVQLWANVEEATYNGLQEN
ncbi:Beta-lactamase domain-containing protein [Fusarium falciforme]|uniref:Beta-lactamase domain-containing protein n=1 Tax=Fusarium falciforme TaxID=195108 RepID=UPI0023002995|nr:Beta-lactamase domain-containing protein [Fusarium falciforme]WAO86011.1 Beta-lactamase domain-containing protein [Fusarium falciforme]